MTKSSFYRLAFPFRSRRQKRLRGQRENVTWEVFSRGIEADPRNEEVIRLLWDHLRKDQAFVEDFRPLPEDDLAKIYAMGPEEVRDDLISPIAEKLNLDLSRYDFEGFDFASLKTPSDVAIFLMSLASNKSEIGAASQPLD